MTHRRTGYWRVGIGVLVLLLSVLLLYLASPLVAEQARPLMQTASTPDQCTVVRAACHGERVGINAEYEPIHSILALRGGCSGPDRPIDQLNYTASWTAGRCGVSAAVPDDCADRYTESRCDAMRSALSDIYG